MEKVLLRLARQLNAFDEASLMALWESYAQKVQDFEPTRRWEEAALVFSFIQAMRWKNQLFNHNWAAGVRPAPKDAKADAARLALLTPDDPLHAFTQSGEAGMTPVSAKGSPLPQAPEEKQKAKVLRFTRKAPVPAHEDTPLPDDE